MDVIEKVNGYGPTALARLAECVEPDSHVSEGADFLAHVRDKVIDLVERHVEEEGGPRAEVVARYREFIQGEAAWNGRSTDLDEKWRQFVDLRAYEENIAELGTPTNNTIEGRADLALFSIGFRLASQLVSQIEEGSK
jgi:hypothetical protein